MGNIFFKFLSQRYVLRMFICVCLIGCGIYRYFSSNNWIWLIVMFPWAFLVFFDGFFVLFAFMFGKTITDESYTSVIKKCNELCGLNLGPLYVVPFWKAQACILPVGTKPIFFTKLLWKNLTQDERLFILAHEIGHAVVTDGLPSAVITLQRRQEYQADAFGIILNNNLVAAAGALERVGQLNAKAYKRKPRKSDYHPPMPNRIAFLETLSRDRNLPNLATSTSVGIESYLKTLETPEE